MTSVLPTFAVKAGAVAETPPAIHLLMRIRKAFQRGYQSGRFWRRNQSRILLDDLTRMNPYTTFMPGVQCHVAWKIGFYTAFRNADKAPARDWSRSREIYAI